jgi:glutamate synthase (NADPH/NADH) small chain
MPAYAFEVELAKADGVQFLFQSQPKRILSDANDHVTGVEFLRTRSVAGRKSAVEIIEGSESIVPCDMVVKALGQVPISDWFASIPELRLHGKMIAIDPATGKTSVHKLFAGGDCVRGGAELVDAVQDGKVAAAGIHQFLSIEDGGARSHY